MEILQSCGACLALVIWDIVPNLAFWGALAMFLTMTFRTRLAGAISTFVLYIGWCALSLGLPLEVINEPREFLPRLL